MDGHHFLDPSGNTRALIGHALALDLDCLRRHLALAGPNAGPDAVPICMLAGAAEHMHAHRGADPHAVDRPHARMAAAAITSERGSPSTTTILHADALCIWPMHDCMSAWETSRFPSGRAAGSSPMESSSSHHHAGHQRRLIFSTPTEDPADKSLIRSAFARRLINRQVE